MDRTNKIIIVLGGSNDDQGQLSQVTISRLSLCLENYQEGDRIICTGSWGPKFNQTEKPHAFYAEKYLKKNGIADSAFLKAALSRNSVEDAVKSKQILHGLSAVKILVISSDFHIERVKLIFDQVFDPVQIEYQAAASDFLGKELEKFIRHEQKAIAWIHKNGLRY